MLCPNCKKLNLDSAKACKWCGLKFSAPDIILRGPPNGELAQAKAEAAQAKGEADAAKAEAAKAKAEAEVAQAEAATAKADAARAEAAQAKAEADAAKAKAAEAAAGTRRTGVLVGIALVAAAVGGAGGYGITSRVSSSVKAHLDQSMKDLAQAKAALASAQANNTKIKPSLLPRSDPVALG
jgi:hypothetical protein